MFRSNRLNAPERTVPDSIVVRLAVFIRAHGVHTCWVSLS